MCMTLYYALSAKFRGTNFSRHTEDNSPKYRMIGKIISALRSFATAQDDVQRNETVIAIMTYKKDITD